MGAIKLSSDDIKAAVASYWRYSRQCPIVAFECNPKLGWGGELADVLAVIEGQYLVAVEVKISLGDFRRDRYKGYHLAFSDNTGVYPVVYFYFAVPVSLANKIAYTCDQLFPYAGVLGCSSIHDYDVYVYRNPKRLRCIPMKPEQIKGITKAQTATLCRLARKVAEQKQEMRTMKTQLKEYRDMETLRERTSEG